MKKFGLIALSVVLAVALVGAGLSAYAWYWTRQAVEMDAERIPNWLIDAGYGAKRGPRWVGRSLARLPWRLAAPGPLSAPRR